MADASLLSRPQTLVPPSTERKAWKDIPSWPYAPFPRVRRAGAVAALAVGAVLLAAALPAAAKIACRTAWCGPPFLLGRSTTSL